jgi:RND family efflux transporter MFP subunit
MMQKTIISALIAGALGLSGCSQEASEVAQSTAKTIETYTVAEQMVPAMTSVPGMMVSDQQAKMASRLMGYIRDLEVNVGDWVQKGDLLFSIDPVDLDSASSQAAAAVAQARAAMRDAKADFERFQALFADGSVPAQQLDKMRLQYEVAVQNVKKAEAGQKQASGQLAYADVRAPFEGMVVQKMAVPGELAAPGHPIVVLENQDRLLAQVNVSGEVFETLKKGQRVWVEIDGQSDWVEGEIERLVNAANPMTRSHLVKVKLAQTVRANSGNFVRVHFPAGQSPQMMVPTTAITTRAGVTGVMVVNAQERLNFRLVRPGRVEGDQTQILAGLLAGERVVTEVRMDHMVGDWVK